MKEYDQWEFSKSIISVKTESIEKENLQFFNNCSFSEGLMIDSATFPNKGKSPLLKKRHTLKEENKLSCFKPS